MKTPRSKPESGQTLLTYLDEELRPLGDPVAAKAMSAYMKTTQPFLGVKQPVRTPIFREMCKRFPPADRHEYLANIAALWKAGKTAERDLQYAAIFYLERFKVYHDPALLKTCHGLIADGAWWDLVDWITLRVVNPIVLKHRDQAEPIMRQWSNDRSLWVRRAAIISQLSHKKTTNETMLYEFCLARAHEEDFFIRKAIGWALRQYAYANPAGVKAFLTKHRSSLSNLSIREAGKHIGITPDKPAKNTTGRTPSPKRR